MSGLALAIKKEQWELVSLCLLLGLWEVLKTVPPEALDGLLDVVSGNDVSKQC